MIRHGSYQCAGVQDVLLLQAPLNFEIVGDLKVPDGVVFAGMLIFADDAPI